MPLFEISGGSRHTAEYGLRSSLIRAHRFVDLFFTQKHVMTLIRGGSRIAYRVARQTIPLIRMHSSRMRTARLLPVTPSMHCSRGWVYLPRGVYLPGECTCPGRCTCPGAVPARGCTCLRGLPAWEVYLLGGVPAGGVPAQTMYLPRGCTCPGGVPAWEVYLPGGVPAQGVYLPRGCTCLGGVPAQGCTCPGE